MVGERMSKYRDEREKSEADIVIRGLACCGEKLGTGVWERLPHKTAETFYSSPC